MNSAVFWTALCLAPSSVLGDQGTYISSSVFCFKVLRVKSRNLFLYYHFVILYVQHKGSHSLPLDAMCNEHGVTVAQNLKEWEHEESGGLFKDWRQNFLDSLPVQYISHPSLSTPAHHLLQADPQFPRSHSLWWILDVVTSPSLALSRQGD